jgi:hypothetical protein
MPGPSVRAITAPLADDGLAQSTLNDGSLVRLVEAVGERVRSVKLAFVQVHQRGACIIWRPWDNQARVDQQDACARSGQDLET